mgnify:CR=1 FL=1
MTCFGMRFLTVLRFVILFVNFSPGILQGYIVKIWAFAVFDSFTIPRGQSAVLLFSSPSTRPCAQGIGIARALMR